MTDTGDVMSMHIRPLNHLCRDLIGATIQTYDVSLRPEVLAKSGLHKLRQPQPDDRAAHVVHFTAAVYNPDHIKRQAAKLGLAVGEFAQRLFAGDHPWSKLRQGHKLLRLGERYTAQRLDAACQRALDVDLINVKRVERILIQALEEKTTPQRPLPLQPGRFARPGSVFAQSDPYRQKSA